MKGKVNKSDIVTELAIRFQISPELAESAIDSILRRISDTLVADGRVEVRGFGSFTVKKYGSYKGRNPNTGKTIPVAPKKMPVFKVGKEFKLLVDKYVDQPGH